MSLIELREGHAFAAQMLESASHLPKCMFDERGPTETMACNLEQVARIRPPDYAKGINQVIEVLRHGQR